MNQPASLAAPAGRPPVAAAGGPDATAPVRLPAALLLALLRAYQRFVSPVLPVVTLGGCGCRFSPTCSHYAAQAIRTHGALGGSWLALRRLVKCTPLHAGGFDPVPPKRPPVCVAADRRAAALTPSLSHPS